MMEVGRLCVKIAGRDAGKKCVIVEVLDEKFVLVDGETRRRKCNMKHLEPSNETIKIKKSAPHTEVAAEFKKMGIELQATKPRQHTEKPKQLRAADRKKAAPKQEAKKPAVKAEKAAPVKKSPAVPAKKETKLEKAVSDEKKE